MAFTRSSHDCYNFAPIAGGCGMFKEDEQEEEKETPRCSQTRPADAKRRPPACSSCEDQAIVLPCLPLRRSRMKAPCLLKAM